MENITIRFKVKEYDIKYYLSNSEYYYHFKLLVDGVHKFIKSSKDYVNTITIPSTDAGIVHFVLIVSNGAKYGIITEDYNKHNNSIIEYSEIVELDKYLEGIMDNDDIYRLSIEFGFRHRQEDYTGSDYWYI